MKRSLAASLIFASLGAGCVSQQPWTPTVDTYGGSRAQGRAHGPSRSLAHRGVRP